jgi:hypothetical protein
MYNKTYLGDGVYAEWDGHGIELRVNDNINPTDICYLEPAVMKALIDFYNQILGIE